MKKIICLINVFFLILCGCSKGTDNIESGAYVYTKDDSFFTRTQNGNLISKSGVEYTFLANEGTLYYFGDLEFVGGIEGEEKSSQHLSLTYKTGMFNIKNNNDNVLIRNAPNNEWASIYRKTSLPAFDFSTDNCIRLEFVYGYGKPENVIHTTCKGGINDKSEIEDFFSKIILQENPCNAGLYDLIKKPDGTLENCYVYGVIYGFFEAEPNLVIQMPVTSYNDLAYSVTVNANEYILPTEWFEKFLTTKCNP